MARVLTGDRPTGPLHLGHYFGTLANRVRLQREGHDVFVVIADYQVMIDRDDLGALRERTLGLARDYAGVGLDPERTTVFAHSAVPALNQLLLPFLSLVGVGELERNPTVKDELRSAGRTTVTGLTLTYPAHQAADILFCKGELVPVGRDQLPHLELTRLIARRFAERFAPIFPVPEALLSEVPLLLGLDGRKMSKSLDNTIALSDSRAVIAAKIRAARTDPERTITYEPGRRPEVSNLVLLAALCTGRPPESVAASVGGSGAGALKEFLVESIDGLLAPIRARRDAVSDAALLAMLRHGAGVAREHAEATLTEVRAAMAMDLVALA